MGLWNLAWILRNCRIAGGFESVKKEGILLFAKVKSSKRFYALRARFYAESKGNRRICGMDSVSLWILRWILRIRRIHIKNIKRMVVSFGELKFKENEDSTFWISKK